MRKKAVQRKQYKINISNKDRHFRSSKQDPKIKWRFYFIISLLLLGILGLIIRMVQLGVFERSFLLKQSDARILRIIHIPAHRGMITDRNGVPLAISTPVDSVWANPKMFEIHSRKLNELSRLLQISPWSIKERVKRNKKREFVYLKRGLPPQIVMKIRLLNIPGVFFQRGFRRYYPEAQITAHVIGLTNIDDQGQEGLELAYNKWLAGIPGRKEVLKDRLGHIIADVDVLKKPVQGKDLTLSIDSRFQYLAYRVLKATVEKFHARSGSVVILDVKTGEILAMVNLPSYNPNHRPKVRDGRYRNRAVTDMFEPGSTMKAFSITNALDSGQYTPNTLIDTNPGWMVINGNVIRDDARNGVITVTQVLQKSSNVGVAKMTLSLPPQSLWNLLHRFGFGVRTQSGFPGEISGMLIKRHIWRPTDLATLSFGYGVSVTALQLAHAYAVIADGGIKQPVTFLKLPTPLQGERVMREKMAKEMLTMLETVLKPGGTGRRARVPGYQIAGKTGTAYIVGPNGYNKDHYVASFVGIAPANHPRLVVAVVVRDVSGKQHFGGQVAAPAFAQIMGGALRYLNIQPDATIQ